VMIREHVRLVVIAQPRVRLIESPALE